MSGFDLAGTGNNPYENCLSRASIEALLVEWEFDSARAGRNVAPIHATPVINRQGTAFVGDMSGSFFAIDNDGELAWAFRTDPPSLALAALIPAELGPPTATPVLGAAALAKTRPYVVVGDAAGEIYVRHQRTGQEIWTRRGLNPNPVGGVAGNSVTIVGDTVLIGMASLENYALVLASAGIPLECCTHQGALIALDLETGEERWRFVASGVSELLPPELLPFTYGPSGADIWSQPTYDPETDTVFVSTGQNLSPNALGQGTPTSDAIIAIDFQTGEPLWIRQFTENDIWVVGVENPEPTTGRMLDMDMGDAPKLYTLPDGRKVVGAGQKDGRYHVVDRTTGELVSSTAHIVPRNALGGFQTGGAYADGMVFQHGMHSESGPSDCASGPCLYEGFEGRVMALTADGRDELWTLSIPGSPVVGGLSIANELLYFQSPVEELQPLADDPAWGLYVVDSVDGSVLQTVMFPGRAVGTPAVVNGKVYVTSGNVALAAYSIVPQGSVIRLGLGEPCEP
ncbi:MAG: PQQ-binding-like beta-propeller repeat protein [Myxococcales bacterium]|nr:PQQ-binding-like beta-propeller repeat protein [Myxococcales bacterium]